MAASEALDPTLPPAPPAEDVTSVEVEVEGEGEGGDADTPPPPPPSSSSSSSSSTPKAGEEKELKPFQTLQFLVRDWQNFDYDGDALPLDEEDRAVEV